MIQREGHRAEAISTVTCSECYRGVAEARGANSKLNGREANELQDHESDLPKNRRGLN